MAEEKDVQTTKIPKITKNRLIAIGVVVGGAVVLGLGALIFAPDVVKMALEKV